MAVRQGSGAAVEGCVDLVARLKAGDPRALARAMSLVENRSPLALDILAGIYAATGRALVIGVTGAAGAGKSTLVAGLAGVYRARGLTVGVVAVDPSSPFTGGAFLGDRLRLDAHSTDAGVFIRSMATRGHLGGIAAASGSLVDLLDAAGYDVIVVETVGAGQEDVEVATVVRWTLLVLTPAAGDAVQALKAGIMEAAQVYVINKADLEGAERLEAVLRAHLEIADLGVERPILQTVATRGAGLAELADALAALERGLDDQQRAERELRHARARLRAASYEAIAAHVEAELAAGALREDIVARVAARALHPEVAAAQLVARVSREVRG